MENTKRGRGRPKSDVVIDWVRFNLRVEKKEYETIKNNALEHKQSINQYIISQALKG